MMVAGFRFGAPMIVVRTTPQHAVDQRGGDGQERRQSGEHVCETNRQQNDPRTDAAASIPEISPAMTRLSLSAFAGRLHADSCLVFEGRGEQQENPSDFEHPHARAA